jgi:general secretion pathway protein G
VLLGPHVCACKIDHNKNDSTKSMMDLLATALDAFHADVHHYPSTGEGLAALRSPDSLNKVDQAHWRGPYIVRTARDGRGEPLEYRCCNPDGRFELRSQGNGQPMEYSGQSLPNH